MRVLAPLAESYRLVTEAARERLGAEPYWALISQDERDKAAASGAAMPDGSYPITTCDGENSVDSAISAVGRGGADHDTIRRHIIKRARSLGCSSKIPENWNGDGSLKTSAQVGALQAMLQQAYAGDASALIDWYNEGADGAIDWCSPGDFEACVGVAGDHIDDPEGFCNERHQDACGGPPGSEDHAVRHPAAGFMHNGGRMAPRTRDSIINDWFASGPGAAAKMAANAVTAAGAVPPAPSAPVKPPGGDATPPKPGEAPPAAAGDHSDEPGTPTEAKVDATVTESITNASSAVKRALKLQQDDPGNATDMIDAKVLAGLEQVDKLLDGVMKDQGADNDANEGDSKPVAVAPKEDPAGMPEKPSATDDGGGTQAPSPPPAATAAEGTEAFAGGPAPKIPTGGSKPNETPGNAEGVPGDGDDSGPGPGDIEADLICQNPDCGHSAGLHTDNDDGGNSGPCTTPGCSCPGMVPQGNPVSQPDNSNDGGKAAPVEEPAPAVTAASTIDLLDIAAPGGPGAEPMPPPSAPVDDKPQPETQLPPLDAQPQQITGPAFTIPVGLIEGVPTGDGRQVAPDAITWRTPPLPLMWLQTSPHDPSGMSGNDPAFLAGRIDSVSRDGANIVANGFFLATKEGMRAAEQLEQMGRFGVSADIGAAEVQITTAGPGPEGVDVFDAELVELLVAGELMGFTGCPFAAFAGCYIVLGDGAEAPAKDLAPAPADSKMAINFVNEIPCEPCGEGLDPAPLVASAAPSSAGGPLAPPRSWFDDPGFTMGDGRLRETIDAKTGKPSGKFACPMSVDENGRIFGHIAQWGVCHQSPNFLQNGQCIMAPRSKTGYSWFHGRGSVLTAEGEVIGVGRLSADAGHAATNRSMTAAQAIAHYDNSALTAAVVRAGEDEFGIWVAGSVHPSASPEQVFTLRANPPSGDWRPVGAGQELVAVLAVGEPGFPVATATVSPQTGHIKSLVAAGVPLFEMPANAPRAKTIEERMDEFERSMKPVFAVAREGQIARMQKLRTK